MGSALAVGLGGALGSLARWGLREAALALGAQAWWGTWVANAFGCFVLGAVLGFVESERGNLSDSMRLFLTLGLTGGLTTFSTFSVEVLNWLRAGQWPQALAYALLSVFFGVLCAFLGRLFF
jgi:CrcB protein